MPLPVDPYPPNLTWRVITPRLLILNQGLVLVGSLAQYNVGLLDPTLAPTLGWPYYAVLLECVGFWGLLVNTPLVIGLARRAWRQTPDAAERCAQLGVFRSLSGAVRWQILLALIISLPVSALLTQAMFGGILSSPLGHWLPQVEPPFPMVLFNGAYGGALIWIYEYFQDRAALSEAREKLAQKLSAQAQLDRLRSQLDPHMLFNTLSNLYELIDESPAQARAMLGHLIGFLRSTLMGSRVTEHALDDEFKLASDYLALMKIRMGDRLQIQLTLPHDLTRALVPAMLLQPLVENAIKHGLEWRKGDGLLSVSAAKEDAQLVLRIGNSGAHRPEALPPLIVDATASRFGLHYVQDRLRALYGRTAQFTLQHLPEQDMTEVVVRMPLQFIPIQHESPGPDC